LHGRGRWCCAVRCGSSLNVWYLSRWLGYLYVCYVYVRVCFACVHGVRVSGSGIFTSEVGFLASVDDHTTSLPQHAIASACSHTVHPPLTSGWVLATCRLQANAPKSKKPSSHPFKQQTLKAWKPVLAPANVVPTFFGVGVSCCSSYADVATATQRCSTRHHQSPM
jgi:hypothetical protein